MWRLNNIVPINCILYTHNFYTDGKPKIYMQLVKIHPAILWQFMKETLKLASHFLANVPTLSILDVFKNAQQIFYAALDPCMK